MDFDFGGCTTLDENSKAINKACKSGVSEYDDGTTSFKCKDDQSVKSDSPHNLGRK